MYVDTFPGQVYYTLYGIKPKQNSKAYAHKKLKIKQSNYTNIGGVPALCIMSMHRVMLCTLVYYVFTPFRKMVTSANITHNKLTDIIRNLRRLYIHTFRIPVDLLYCLIFCVML